MKSYTTKEIIESKAHFNKWLKELTESETELIIEMMEEYKAPTIEYERKDDGKLYCNLCKQHIEEF